MPTLLEGFRQLCTEGQIPETRRKNFLTSLRYLAAAYDSTPDLLPLTPTIEEGYRLRVREYLASHPSTHGKPHGPYTIRNTLQEIGQYLRKVHAIQHTPPVRLVKAPILGSEAAQHALRETSPYQHYRWLQQSQYFLPVDQWPDQVKKGFETYRRLKRTAHRLPTQRKHLKHFRAYVGYLSMTGEARLDHVPAEARKKLSLDDYREDLDLITSTPILSSWDSLFQKDLLESFVTWHAWRIHTPFDAKVEDRPPSKPSTTGSVVVKLIAHIATALGRGEASDLIDYRKELAIPKKIHDKRAAYHTFSFSELEQVGLALIAEARGIPYQQHYHDTKYPGSVAATHFQVGLILVLAWRNPMRARNWCEALLGTNLRKPHGSWHWHFEGEELKVGTRRGERNILDIEVDSEVATLLDEYLNTWRPLLPNAADDRHVFLSKQGRPLRGPVLRDRLRINVFRHTGKFLYTHLLRTLFASNHISNGVDINSVAYGLGDTPAMVWKAYNEVHGEQHQQFIHEANRRALLSGNGTPP